MTLSPTPRGALLQHRDDHSLRSTTIQPEHDDQRRGDDCSWRGSTWTVGRTIYKSERQEQQQTITAYHFKSKCDNGYGGDENQNCNQQKRQDQEENRGDDGSRGDDNRDEDRREEQNCRHEQNCERK